MRTRHDNTVDDFHAAFGNFLYTGVTTTCAGVATTGSPVTYYAEPAYPCLGKNETMHDDLGRFRSNKVIHRKMEYDITKGAPGGYIKPIPAPPYGTTSYTNPQVNIADCEYYSRVADSGISGFDVTLTPPLGMSMPAGWTVPIPDVDEDQLLNDLLDRAKGLEADALLNIVEGNQIWPAFRSIAQTLPNLRRNWGRVRRVLKTASSSFLAWKFGVSPLISDITSIVRFAPEMSRQYEKYKEGKIMRLTRYYPLPGTFSIPDSTSTANGYTYRRVSYVGSIEVEPYIRYVLLVRPTAPRYGTEAFNKLQFSLGRFASSPASLAWEKVPFSFVADWLVDSRAAIRGIDRLLGHEPYEILSWTRSFGYKLRTQSKHSWLSTCNGSLLSEWLCSTRLYSHYERIPLSARDLFPHWRGFYGKNQAAVTAALIAQRLRA